MFRLLKPWYWKWVISCIKDEMEELDFWLPKVNKRERRLIMKEKTKNRKRNLSFGMDFT
jgi:hypothetical protein